MAKVLRACGDLVSGFHRLECHADDCADLPTFCEYLEAKLELNSKLKLESNDGGLTKGRGVKCGVSGKEFVCASSAVQG